MLRRSMVRLAKAAPSGAAKPAAKGAKAAKPKAGASKTPGKAEKEESKEKKPRRPKEPNLEDLIKALPRPANYNPKDRSTWLHKNGFGMKFFRKSWLYPEPCFWTLKRWKPREAGGVSKGWGVLTWRGVTEEKVREIRGIRKREWAYIPQPDLEPLLQQQRSSQQQQQQQSAAAGGGAAGDAATAANTAAPATAS